MQQAVLAVPKRYLLIKLKAPRLRDLKDATLRWSHGGNHPAFYDRLIHECSHHTVHPRTKAPGSALEGPSVADRVGL